jgi:hypothetical protein
VVLGARRSSLYSLVSCALLELAAGESTDRDSHPRLGGGRRAAFFGGNAPQVLAVAVGRFRRERKHQKAARHGRFAVEGDQSYRPPSFGIRPLPPEG